jgi:hypothetical protein
LKTLANISVQTFEPVLQLGITVGITVDLVQGIKKVIGTGGVGKAFDESLEFGQ